MNSLVSSTTRRGFVASIFREAVRHHSNQQSSFSTTKLLSAPSLLKNPRPIYSSWTKAFSIQSDVLDTNLLGIYRTSTTISPPPTSRCFSSTSSHDEDDGFLSLYELRWIKRYEELREYKKEHKHLRIPFRSSLGRWALSQRTMARQRNGRLSRRRRRLLERLGFPFDCLKYKWEYMFNELKAHYKKHGHFSISYKDNRNLVYWVENQRKHYKLLHSNQKSYLTRERLRKLNQIGFPWDPLETQWTARYNELKEYKEKHGNCLVRSDFENQPLARWVALQRHEYRLKKRKKPSTMTDDRIQRLKKLDFAWDGFPVAKKRWSERYQELKEFQAEFGHCRVSHKYEPNLQLHPWVANQRFLGNNSRLTKEQVSLLNEIGFSWQKNRRTWMEGYNELKEFWETHGHCLPSPSEHRALSKWVYSQRSAYKRKVMSKDRVEKLKEINFLFDVPKDEWDRKCRIVKEFIDENGHDRVPVSHPMHPFLSKARQLYRLFLAGHESSMTEARAARLTAAGVQWTRENWHKNFKLLEAFHEKHGHIVVDTSEYHLLRFVRFQRLEYKHFKQGKPCLLTDEMVAKLHALGFDSEAPYYQPKPRIKKGDEIPAEQTTS